MNKTRFTRGQYVAYFPTGKSKFPQKRRVTSLDETYVMIEDVGRNPAFHPVSGQKIPYMPSSGGMGYITELTPELNDLAEVKRITDRMQVYDFAKLPLADLKRIAVMMAENL